eukprot:scaffold76594_cov58-Phaeocystis_antarctica.AAC.3
MAGAAAAAAAAAAVAAGIVAAVAAGASEELLDTRPVELARQTDHGRISRAPPHAREVGREHGRGVTVSLGAQREAARTRDGRRNVALVSDAHFIRQRTAAARRAIRRKGRPCHLGQLPGVDRLQHVARCDGGAAVDAEPVPPPPLLRAPPARSKTAKSVSCAGARGRAIEQPRLGIHLSPPGPRGQPRAHGWVGFWSGGWPPRGLLSARAPPTIDDAALRPLQRVAVTLAREHARAHREGRRGAAARHGHLHADQPRRRRVRRRRRREVRHRDPPRLRAKTPARLRVRRPLAQQRLEVGALDARLHLLRLDVELRELNPELGDRQGGRAGVQPRNGRSDRRHGARGAAIRHRRHRRPRSRRCYRRERSRRRRAQVQADEAAQKGGGGAQLDGRRAHHDVKPAAEGGLVRG